jgi:hypothetical protein
MRHFIIIGFLLAAVTSPGQIYVDSYRFSPATPTGLLLDNYPGAAAAYSLRKLRTAYTGNVIMVRRSSDGDSLNVGFSGNYLDTAALKSFCGTGATNTCYVRVWYDQSGNNYNLSMSTDNNIQPIIVSGGNLITQQGSVALQFDGIDDYLVNSTKLIDSSANVYCVNVFSTTSTASNQIIYSLPSGITSNRGMDLRILNSTQIQSSIGTYPITNSTPTGSNAILTFNYSSGNFNLLSSSFYASLASNEHKMYINQSSLAEISNSGTGITNTGNNGGLLIGRFGVTNNFGAFFNGKYAEFIIYKLDQTSNRVGIETNINNFYSIY